MKQDQKNKSGNDIRGAGNQNVKGQTNTQPIRDTDQNVDPSKRPQQPEGKMAGRKLPGR